METPRRRIKRRVPKPRTFKNVLKKRLSSDYWKASILILAIFIILGSIAGYVFLTTPISKSFDEEDESLKEIKRLKEEMKGKKK